MMATPLDTGGVWRANYHWQDPMSGSVETTSTDHFWPSPFLPQTSDYFRCPIWNKTTTDPPLRALEELHLEISYLIDSLQVQTQIANQLRRKIPVLESKLQQPGLRPLHRKIRKQLGWLKSRLGQSSQQEQTISSRLDELASEIQTREQWAQMEQEQLLRDMHQREQISGYQQGLCDGLQLRNLSLDPTQPEFSPQGLFPQTFCPQWQQQVLGCEQATEDTSKCPRKGSDEILQKELPKCELTAGKYNSHNPSFSRRSASMDGVDLRHLAGKDPKIPVSMFKRHSFPNVSGHSKVRPSTAEELAQTDVEGEQVRGLDGRFLRQASIG